MPDTTPESQLLTPDSDEINLLDYWAVIVKRKAMIAVFVGAAAITSVIASLLLPDIYAATTSILPPQQDATMGTTVISQLPGGLGNLAGGVLGVQTPSDLWIGILNSETIKDALVDRFDLMSAFEAETRTDAREALTGMVKIVNSKEDIIAITVESEDPKQAADLANALVEELDRINRSLVMTSGRRMKNFVEERLKGAQRDLAATEEALKEAMGKLKGELMAKEVALQTLLSYAAPTNPQVGLLKSEVESLKARLREMGEGGGGTNPSSEDIFIPTSKLPDLGLQYVRLLRNAKIQQTVFELLTQQYEMARIQEAKDTPTVQVLDVATVPEKKVKPKRRQIVILSTVISAFLALMLCFFLEYVEKAKQMNRTRREA
jgi:tyrosine-protein kinase Etk/Wzc